MADLIFRHRDLQGGACTYVAWGKSECLYVGMSSQGFFRPFSNATLTECWSKIERIEIDWCANSDVARGNEIRLIAKLRPVLNRNSRGTIKTQRESALIADAMIEAHGDKLKAAKLLGISRATLYRRLGPQRSCQ